MKISIIAGALLAATAAVGAPSDNLKKEVIADYARLVHDSYEKNLELTLAMQKKIEAFLAAPSQSTMDEAKAAWLVTRDIYGQTEAYRFYSGPIDSANGPEGRINAWPMSEAFVDYVAGKTDAGIINNPAKYPTIDADLLKGANGANEDEANVATGYHAIEFLLWGQDLYTDSAGKRPYTDFIVGGTASNQARRATYLKVVTQLLVDDLQGVMNEWKDNAPGNYRAQFLAMPADTAITNILNGIHMMSGFELSNQRMYAAYETLDQEDEHSCFSDNTHNDFVANQLGIMNVWSGKFMGKDYLGLEDLVQQADAAVAKNMSAMAELAMEEIKNIPQPFDQAIQANNPDGLQAVLTAVEALDAQTLLINKAGAALGIHLEITE